MREFHRTALRSLARLSLLLWLLTGPSAAIPGQQAASDQTTTPSNSKRPVPDSEAIRQSESTIRRVFSEKYNRAKSPLSKASLAKELLKTALETKDDPTGAYVLLSEARKWGTEGGDVSTAFAAIAALETAYQVDGLAQRAEVLKRIDSTEFPATAAREAADAILPVVDEATANDSFSIAKSTIAVGLVLASRLRDGALTTELKRLETEAARLEKQFDAFQAAEQTLKTSPMDKGAHRVAARYLAMRKRDWVPAAWHASFTDDGPLRDVLSHQSAETLNASAKLALADEWWDLADGLDGIHKAQAREISGNLYREVISGLSGLTLRRVQDRLDSLPKIAPRPSIPAQADNVPRQKVTFLTTLKEKSVEYWKYAPNFGFSKDGKIPAPDPSNPKRNILHPIKLGGVESPNALWLHPKTKGRSNIVYDIGSLNAHRFTATVGVCDVRQYGPHTPLTFSVVGDGKSLWTSQPVKAWGQPQFCEVSVVGVKVLELRCECPGDAAFANAVWCEPRLTVVSVKGTPNEASNGPSSSVPKHAVTKGGLSAWTVPSPIIAGKPYRLYIEVRSPSGTDDKAGEYSPKGDIRLEIKGSDGYIKRTTFKDSEPITIKPGLFQLWADMPGAAPNTRDRITVKSTALKEEVSLDVGF